jgi:hypothetical protein
MCVELFRCMVVSAYGNLCDCTGLDGRDVVVGLRFTSPYAITYRPVGA